MSDDYDSLSDARMRLVYDQARLDAREATTEAEYQSAQLRAAENAPPPPTWTRECAPPDVLTAAQALVAIHDDPMVCTPGPRTAAAIDELRAALTATGDAPSGVPTDLMARMFALAAKWDLDLTTYPVETVREAKFAAKALEMCTRELRDALRGAE